MKRVYILLLFLVVIFGCFDMVLAQNYQITGLLINGNNEVSITTGTSICVSPGDVIQFIGTSTANTTVGIGLSDPMLKLSHVYNVNVDANGTFIYPNSFIEASNSHVISYENAHAYYEFLFDNGFIFTVFSNELQLPEHVLDAMVNSYTLDNASVDEDIIEYVNAIQNVYQYDTNAQFDRNKLSSAKIKLEEWSKDTFIGKVDEYADDVVIYGLQTTVCLASHGTIGCSSLLLHIAKDLENARIELAYQDDKMDEETRNYLINSTNKKYGVISFLNLAVDPNPVDALLFVSETVLEIEDESDASIDYAFTFYDEYVDKYFVEIHWDFNYNSQVIPLKMIVEGDYVPVSDSSPQLFSPSISPPSGDVNTDFTFSIGYSDLDNDAPDWVKVVIDGYAYPLTSSDTDYSDGATFSNSTPFQFDAGIHNYRFTAQQGTNVLYVPAQGSPDFSFTVTSEGGVGGDPVLSVSPNSLNFGEKIQGKTYVDAIEIFNAGGGDLDWSASVISGSSWISLDETGGQTPSSFIDDINVTINTTSLSPGNTHTGTVRITSTNGGGPEDVTVSVYINDGSDQYEDNPEEDPYVIELNQTVVGNIFPIGDQDWFQTNVTQTGRLTCTIEDPGKVDRVRIYLPDNNDYYFDPDRDMVGEQVCFTIDPTPLGTYTVKLYNIGDNDANQNMFYSWTFKFEIPETNPPAITNVSVDPNNVLMGTSFTITASITDASGINQSSVKAYLQNPDESNVATIPMYDDGSNGGDQTSGDHVYTGSYIPSNMNEEIYFVDIVASDTKANHAESENVKTVQIYDLPAFSNFERTPLSPTSNDQVLIECDITDQSNISNATLFYSLNSGSSLLPLQMNNSSGVNWGATIPAQSISEVQYKVEATDNKGNTNTSTIHNYTITIVENPPDVTSILPNTANAGSTVNISDLAGHYFQSGAEVLLRKSGNTDIIATSATVVSSTQITCDFNLNGAVAGTWNVVVINPDAQTSGTSGNGLFTITTGSIDTTPPNISDVQFSHSTIPLTLGNQCTISARVTDESGVDLASVKTHIQNPDENTLAVLQMYDDGINGGDQTAGDDIYTGQGTISGVPVGTYYADIVAADTKGNSTELENAVVFEVSESEPEGLPFTDDFSDNNYEGWDISAGLWSAGSGYLTATSHDGPHAWIGYACGNTAWTDYFLECDWTYGAGSSSNGDIWFRVQDDSPPASGNDPANG